MVPNCTIAHQKFLITSEHTLTASLPALPPLSPAFANHHAIIVFMFYMSKTEAVLLSLDYFP